MADTRANRGDHTFSLASDLEALGPARNTTYDWWLSSVERRASDLGARSRRSGPASSNRPE